jgi:Flp pilus assembly pilin Flp
MPTASASAGIVARVLRRESGQAGIEWIALIALVAVVLGAAAALTWGGLGPKVAYAIRRGICTVGAERCPAPAPDRPDLPPCPVNRSSREQDFHVELSFIDLGGGLGVQEETTSDGRVTVTFTNSGSGGGVAGVGASFRLGSVRADVGVSAEASVKFTAGKSWTFPDQAAADRFVARYGSDQDLARHVLNDARRLCFFCGLFGVHGPPKPPPADVTYLEGGLRLTLGAEAKAIWGAHLDADLEAAIGHSDERATGERTMYLRLADSASGELFASSGFGTAAGVSGIAQLTVDRHGRPLSLRLETVTTRATFRQEPGYRGPGGDSPQLVKDLHGEGTVKELEADLDLTDPQAAAARAFLHGGGAGALIREIAAHGSTTLRTFAGDSTSGGVGATLALGAEAGGGLSHSSQHLKLTGVYTRLPGLGFLPRADCLVA